MFGCAESLSCGMWETIHTSPAVALYGENSDATCTRNHVKVHLNVRKTKQNKVQASWVK